MKKTFALMLVLTLVLSMAPALALEAQLQAEPPLTETNLKLPSNLKDQLLTRAGAALPQTQDVVAIENGVYSITSLGVTAKTEPPFGWTGFTQNLLLQMSEYLNFFNDPRAVVEWLIDSNISLLLVDLETSAEIHLFFVQDAASQLLNDTQDPAVAEAALKYYQNVTDPGLERSGLLLNDRNFIRSLETNEEGSTLIYLTFLNGTRVGFQLFPAGKEVTSEEEEILVDLIKNVTLA